MKLRAIDICKSYGSQVVLNGVSFEAGSGQCIGLAGPNGCGKTTLLSIIAGIEKASSGQIAIDDEGINSIRNLRDVIGYVPQINPLLEDMSVKDNLWLYCVSKDNMADVSRRFKLDMLMKKKVRQLSGGMKRRLAIACAMAKGPQILVMDEPTTALDIEYKRIIHSEMKQFKESGGTLIIATHEKEELDECDMCYYVTEGRLQTGGIL